MLNNLRSGIDMSNKQESSPLSKLDPDWELKVLSKFRQLEYPASLKSVLEYEKNLASNEDLRRKLENSHYATIYYTIAASAYGVLKEPDENLANVLATFFKYLKKYTELLKETPKNGLNASNVKNLLDNALDLLVKFSPDTLNEEAKYWVNQFIEAWDDKLALDQLLAKIFVLRINADVDRSQVHTQVLAELYLELAEKYESRYNSERVSIMNILSDLIYFSGQDESQDKAYEWVNKCLQLNENDIFAQQRKRNIEQIRTTTQQIQRFQHDFNNEIAGLDSSLTDLRKRFDQIDGDKGTSLCIQKIENILCRLHGSHRLVLDQQENPTQIILNDEIDAITRDFKDDVHITVDSTDSIECEVDREYLALAVSNLIRNSIDAFIRRKVIQKDERWLKIKIHDDPQNVQILLLDNAGGIDPTLRDHIFDSYVSSKGQTKNTGLGLTNARAAITKMNGSLTLSPVQPSNGAEFIIKLPK